MNNKLTPEQLRNKLIEISREIDAGKYKNESQVFKRYIALLVFGEYVLQYDALSEDNKQNFDFDVNGLARKIESMLMSSPSENYGDLEQLTKEEISGSTIKINFRGEDRTYLANAWISGKGITLEKAYRIFKEDGKTIEVREVRNSLEKKAIIEGYEQEIKRVLGKKTD